MESNELSANNAENSSSDIQNENTVVVSSNDGKSGSNSQLSKRKQRRLKREKRWEETRAERRREEKKRRRERRQQDELNGIVRKKPRLPTVSMSNSNCKTIIVVDCDYESFMNENELRKLCKQLMYCYAINRRSQSPAQLWITSVRGKLFELMNRLHPSHHNWDCKVTDKHWTEVLFPNDMDYKSNPKVIYLTGDAKGTIPDCKQINDSNDYVFIIGGLIDHNRHKCLCLKRAREEFQMNCGQLPIEDHIQMSQRRILSIPHVYEIMLLASNGLIDNFSWTEIFQKVIPNRKLQPSSSTNDIIIRNDDDNDVLSH
ncbi:tRNA (Guanine-1)-methyltransferase-like protein [Euroglyphus maynei]|uniref:tRNA (guanine(9)-N(1))-methyltransferase n=1 Tax=Euroglyphus maynei TaxID=6958 RepID=A0A1Y3API3_EURMA|nr:tRNA (Guanine-1)-methyltransferase-like protein [Euroglyphus maynei]